MSPRAVDVILFDIDNVLIDTRSSYLAAIQKTVEIYLAKPGILTPKEVDDFKLLGGFNDDWDCSYGILTFLQTALQGKPVRFGDHRHYRLSIAELRNLISERPLGVEGLLKHLGAMYERVETPSYKKIARIFQEVYLGTRLAKKPLRHWKKPGLIEKEKLIFPKSILEKIRARGIRLGIVTGRDRFEAAYALKRFGILKLFDGLITIDEVKREEKKKKTFLRKPNPWPILEAAKRLQKGGNRLNFLYVGDLPDDILTAKRAKEKIRIKSVAFSEFTQDPKATFEEMKKVGPDYFLKNPKDLIKIAGVSGN